VLNGVEYFMCVLGRTNTSIGASGALHDGGGEERKCRLFDLAGQISSDNTKVFEQLGYY